MPAYVSLHRLYSWLDLASVSWHGVIVCRGYCKLVGRSSGPPTARLASFEAAAADHIITFSGKAASELGIWTLAALSLAHRALRGRRFTTSAWTVVALWFLLLISELRMMDQVCGADAGSCIAVGDAWCQHCYWQCCDRVRWLPLLLVSGFLICYAQLCKRHYAAIMMRQRSLDQSHPGLTDLLHISSSSNPLVQRQHRNAEGVTEWSLQQQATYYQLWPVARQLSPLLQTLLAMFAYLGLFTVPWMYSKFKHTIDTVVYETINFLTLLVVHAERWAYAVALLAGGLVWQLLEREEGSMVVQGTAAALAATAVLLWRVAVADI